MTNLPWEQVTEPWVGKELLWRLRDNPDIFSTNGGVTWYNLNEDLDPEGNPVLHTGAVNA